MGAFNNYVDQILNNFYPPPPSRDGQKWAFDKLSTLCHVTPLDFLPQPPSSCPRSYWMPPMSNVARVVGKMRHHVNRYQSCHITTTVPTNYLAKSVLKSHRSFLCLCNFTKYIFRIQSAKNWGMYYWADSKVEIFLGQREVAFLSPSKSCCKCCGVIRTQPISVLGLVQLYKMNCP